VRFEDDKDLAQILKDQESQIQCVVSTMELEKAVPFGKAQEPGLSDYADRIDTVKFLVGLQG
jgi:hypothetical protein